MIAAIDAIGKAAWPSATPLARAGVTAAFEPLVDALSAAVNGLSLPAAVVARLFNATRPAAWPHALTGGDGITLLGDAILSLAGALTSGDGLPPLLDFASRLAAEATEPWSSRIDGWLDDAVARLGADDDERSHIRPQLAGVRESAPPGRVQRCWFASCRPPPLRAPLRAPLRGRWRARRSTVAGTPALAGARLVVDRGR